MTKIRKKHSSEFKAKVALAALKGDRTGTELVQEFGVGDSQIHKWKMQLLSQATRLFEPGMTSPDVHKDHQIDHLHKTIGQLVAERDFLKKVLKS